MLRLLSFQRVNAEVAQHLAGPGLSRLFALLRRWRSLRLSQRRPEGNLDENESEERGMQDLKATKLNPDSFKVFVPDNLSAHCANRCCFGGIQGGVVGGRTPP